MGPAHAPRACLFVFWHPIGWRMTSLLNATHIEAAPTLVPASRLNMTKWALSPSDLRTNAGKAFHPLRLSAFPFPEGGLSFWSHPPEVERAKPPRAGKDEPPLPAHSQVDHAGRRLCPPPDVVPSHKLLAASRNFIFPSQLIFTPHLCCYFFHCVI